MSNLEDMLKRQRGRRGNNRVHDAIMSEVYARVCQKHPAAKVTMNHFYEKGELDVKAEYDNRIIVYEIKSYKGLRKAKKQVKRYADWETKTVYAVAITPYEVCRMYF